MSSPHARVVLDGAYRVAPVPRRLFGSFVEHMGRCVYGGIFDPGHETADEDGFRGDVSALARELGVTAVRYPGGNFVSGYDWTDGIGPRADRPSRLDRAWKTIESNQVGTDDFLRWAARVGVEPVMAVNLGTAGVQEACDLLEYTNLPEGTRWADERVKNGTPEPYRVRTWCLGNELDGPWQIGHKTAEEYGRLAAETARAMRRVDRDLELVACGSSNSGMPTFGSWEATVLEHTYDLVDHISLHAYYEETDGDRASFLSSAVDMDAMIRGVVATADAVGARRRSPRRLSLSFDEWNVWYQQRFPGEDALDYAPRRALIEDDYTVVDAVVVGDLLMTLLSHADRVAIACQAQLANVIAPIRTPDDGGPAWRQPIFDPFALTAAHARGQVLQPVVSSTRQATAAYGDADVVSVTATHDEEAGEMAVFLVNRSPDSAATVEVSLRDLPCGRLLDQQVLADPDQSAVNTAADPDRVRARPGSELALANGVVTGRLPACSWTMLRVG
ncbi:MAG TPA: alpha-N-arabinofuranosidase [Nocardioidaceae bacterium]|jgi:alpha-N-arabinofuranosidase|nr:alpha-N-arabinofuranosidase [Nocardioidaceae bacterium]